MQIECMLSNAVWGSAMEIQIPTRERKKTRLLIQCSLGRNWSTNEACHRFTAAQCDTHFFCWSKNDAFGADPVRWRIKKKQKLSRKSIPIHHIRNRTQALILKVSAVTFWSYPTACPWGFGTGFALACDNLHPITQILRHIPSFLNCRSSRIYIAVKKKTVQDDEWLYQVGNGEAITTLPRDEVDSQSAAWGQWGRTGLI